MNRPPSSPLRRLDERLVPAAALVLRRTIGVCGTALRSPRGPGAALRAARATPTVAVSVLVVAVAAGLIAATTGPGAGRSGPTSSTSAATIASIGPVPGESVTDYLRNAAFRVRHLGETAPGQPTFAVVDLRDYQTPGEAVAILRGVDVARAYVRVPAGAMPTQVHSVPVTGITRLAAAFRPVAAIASATARSYAVLVRGLHPRSTAERRVRATYAGLQRAAVRDARALARPARCRCVFALVVRATFAQIVALLRTPVVRVVDPAPPPVTLGGLTVFPLEPEITGAVPKTGLHG